MSLGSSSAAFFGAAGAAGAGAGYAIERSLRFNPADSASLTRPVAAIGSQTAYTFSFWLKKNNNSTVYQNILIDDGSTSSQIRINDTTGGFELRFAAAGASAALTTNRKLRDPSAWYHIICVYDSANTTTADRMRIYINGVRETSFLGETQPSDSLFSQFFTNGNTYRIGYYASNTALDGYLGDVHWIDGRALDESSFGEFDDNGVWQPIEYTGTFAAPVTQTPALDGAMIIKADGASIIGTVAASGLKCLYTSSNGIDWTFQNREAVGPFVTYAKYLAIGAAGTNDITFIPGNGESFTYAMYSATTDFTTQSDITVDTTSLSYSAGGTTSYGTNGFHLPLTDNSSASALGTDTSGNGNDWTVNSISAPVTDITIRPRSTTTWTATGGMATHSYFQSPANKTDSNFGYNATLNWNTSGVTTGGTMQLDFATVLATAGDVVDVFQGNPTFETPKLILDNSDNLFPDSSTTSPDTNFQYSTFTIPAGRTCSIVFTTTASGARSSFFGVMVNGVSILTDDPNVNNDSLSDSPTNGTQTDTGVGGEVSGNYATFNPVAIDNRGGTAGGQTLNGNLVAKATNTSEVFVPLTIRTPTSGKYYLEITCDSTQRDPRIFLYPGFSFDSGGYIDALGVNAVAGSLYGLAFDLDTNNLYVYKDNTLINTVTTMDLTRSYAISVYDYDGTGWQYTLNAGQRPFVYSKSGYKALCTANLPDPTIADGSTAMDVVLYNGTGTTQSISGLNLSPDLVWTKNRGVTASHAVYDIVRGAGNLIRTNETTAEVNVPARFISFDTDGYTIGSTSTENNASSNSYVAWTWDAGTEARYSPGLSGTDLRTPFLAFESGSDLDDYDRVARLPGLGTITWTANNNVEPIGNVTNLDLYIYQNASSDTVSFTINGSSATPSSTIRTPSTAYGIYGYRFAVGATVSSFSFTQGSGSARLKRVSADGVDLTESINTDGSLPAAVNANPSTGFSAVRYRGTGATQTIGHGLGVTPSLIICFALDGGFDWGVYHESLGNTHSLRLNTVQEAFAATVYWNDTSPTSSVFTTGGANITGGAYDYIAYCWAPVEGYSSFGGFTASAQADGPFIYTGFRPRWVLIKSRSNTSSYTSWGIFDSEREPNNADYNALFSNRDTPEGYRGDGSTTASLTQMSIDKLSNGFKIRNNGNEFNPVSGYTYVYAAFAENPFKYARAR